MVRHFDIIEYDERILLVEARRDGPVESAGIDTVMIATQYLEPRGVDWDREYQRDVVCVLRNRLSGVDRNLIRERSEGGENARTAYHDAVLGLAHFVQRNVAVGHCVRGNPPIHQRMDNGMGESEIAIRNLALIRNQILPACLIGVLRPDVGLAGEAGKGDVDVVRGATEQAGAVARDAFEARVATDQVLLATRYEVADADRVTKTGVIDHADVGVVDLPVEVAGHSGDGPAKHRVIGDIGHPLPAYPDLTIIAQSLDVLLAVSHRHG